MDKRKYAGEIKEIAEMLSKIRPDKEFLIECIDAIETEEELLGLHKWLVESPLAVRSEVYDKLIDITSGRFQKCFPKARTLKEQYLCTGAIDDLKELLMLLCSQTVYILENWDLTPEEVSVIENADLGDMVHIETESIPVLFDRGDDPAIMRIYTSSMEMPEMLRHEYAIAQRPLTYAWKACGIMQRILNRPIILALDYDSDDYILQDETWNTIIEKWISDESQRPVY